MTAEMFDLVKHSIQTKGKCLLNISGESMIPTLRKGDSIVVEPVSPEEININDAIVFASFERGLGLTCHRVVGLLTATSSPTAKLAYVTMGDRFPREIIIEDDVIGKATKIIRKKRKERLELDLWNWNSGLRSLGKAVGVRKR